MTLAPDQLAALRDIDDTWPGRPAVIIGATALGFSMDMRWRGTADVDLVVAVDVDELSAITRRPGWTQHTTRIHELISPRGVRIDIVAASRALIEKGVVEWPGGHVMSLEGMDLAFAHSVEHATGDGQRVRVAPPAVVAVLKMASYLDRPAERERDLADIAHLFDLYIDEDSDRRWDEAAGVEFDLVPAFLLGRDIGRLLGPARRALVDRFIARVGNPDSSEHSRMERRGRDPWRNQVEPLRRRLDSFRQGFEDALSSS